MDFTASDQTNGKKANQERGGKNVENATPQEVKQKQDRW